MWKLYYVDKDIYEKDSVGQEDKKIYSKGDILTFTTLRDSYNSDIIDLNVASDKDKYYEAPYVIITTSLWTALHMEQYKFKATVVDTLNQNKIIDIKGRVNIGVKPENPNDDYFEKVKLKPTKIPLSEIEVIKNSVEQLIVDYLSSLINP